MAELLVRYTAPLPADFASGTLEIKRYDVYVDTNGRKAQAYYRATINADRSLTDAQTGEQLSIIAAGPGDPDGGYLDWVETLQVAGLPSPLRQTARIPAIYTAEGQIDLHQPNFAVRLIDGPNDAVLAAVRAAQEAIQQASGPRLTATPGTTLDQYSGQEIVISGLYVDPAAPPLTIAQSIQTDPETRVRISGLFVGGRA